MNCVAVKMSLSGYLDRQLSGAQRLGVESHLSKCSDCSLEFSQLSRVRSGLRSLPAAILPDRLRIDLKALASQESFRTQYSRSQVTYWATRLRLVVDNLMRPMALPFAGGLASAVFLFGALMPRISFTRTFANDVPTPIYQEASIVKVHVTDSRLKTTDDTLVEVEIDSQGRPVNYSVPEGEMTTEIGNMILFTTYVPARMFGTPAPGKVLMRRSRIVVKG